VDRDGCGSEPRGGYCGSVAIRVLAGGRCAVGIIEGAVPGRPDFEKAVPSGRGTQDAVPEDRKIEDAVPAGYEPEDAASKRPGLFPLMRMMMDRQQQILDEQRQVLQEQQRLNALLEAALLERGARPTGSPAEGPGPVPE
jgi:hypothetical protein